jgi:hypothetical protein
MLEPALDRGEDSPQPLTIPLDLEREIIETTARLYPRAGPVLLRVAQRVFAWYLRLSESGTSSDQLCCCRIRPIVYETLILQLSEPSWALHPSLLRALKSIPGSFMIRKHVRNLLLIDIPPTVAARSVQNDSDLVLSTCRGVRNLVILAPTPFMSAISNQ